MIRITSACLLTLALTAGEAGPYLGLTPTVPGGIGVATLEAASVPAEAYIAVDAQGHLTLAGRRARYWGIIGGFPNQTSDKDPAARKAQAAQRYADNEALITRFQDLGFNLHRLWRTTTDDYTPGDGSTSDVLDHYVANARAKGFRFWLAGMNPGPGDPKAEDVGIVNDPATADAWLAAVREVASNAKMKGLLNRARAWDPRLEALAIRNASAILTRVNHYTGLRWCDDPAFVAFELSNEEWFMRNMLGGVWQKLPAFFRNELIAQWNAWLLKRHGGQEGLRTAWGTLLPSENLATGSIAFAPMAGRSKAALAINDANAQAVAAVAGSADAEIDPKTLPEARARDVLAFLMDLHVGHKQREAAVIKALGRATRAAPLAYDTGIGYEIQSAWLHQNAEVSVHDAYVNGTYPAKPEPKAPFSDPLQGMQQHLEWERKVNNRGKWVSWLEKPPGLSQGVPWLEHNKHPGKPYFAYETQIQQPAKYRADYPLRLAALASIQDWDIVCWHYWGGVGDVGSSARPFDRKMDITTGGHSQGYHFTFDEVQSAMMRAAGTAWRSSAWAAAAKPTTFIYGRKSMTDPLSMRYAGSYGISGMDMLPTTYGHGVRLLIDPTREDDAVVGPVVKAADYTTHNPYVPTPEITFDHQQGFLRMDAPAAKVWTGFLGKVGGKLAFADGTALDRVSFANPAGIYEPMTPAEGYVSFALYSTDGAPLAQAKRAALSLVSTSFNSGFSLGVDHPDGKTRQGDLPVLTARVAGTVTCPAIDGMRWTMLDWHMQPLASGTVNGGKIDIPSDQPVFVVELER